MKCIGKVQRGNRTLKCSKRCSFLYCTEHWQQYRKKWIRICLLLVVVLLVVIWHNSLYNLYIDATKGEYYEGDINAFFPSSNAGYVAGKGGITLHIGPLPQTKNDSLNPKIGMGCDSSFKISFKPKKDSFVISLSVRDLTTGQFIGQIRNNHFSFKRRLVSKMYSDYNSIEFEDLYGNVVLSIWADSARFPIVCGYFKGLNCVSFYNGPIPMSVNLSDSQTLSRYASSLTPKFID